MCQSWFKRKHIQQALLANGCEILEDPDLREILKKFIQFRQAGSHLKPPIQEAIECFELCESILNGTEDMEERRADLDDFCYTEDWEEKLSASIDDGTTDDFFQDLMRESSIRIEDCPEFPMFKKELKLKLGK